MVIGLFNDSYDPIIDGVGVCVRNYARTLQQRGSTPYVVVPSVPNFVDNAEFNILRYASFQLPVMAPYRAGVPGLDIEFTKRVYSVPFDIVHSHSPFVSGSIALKIARKRRIPIITTFHSKYRDDLRKALYFERPAELALSYLIRFYEAVDHVWVPNEATGATLREYGYEGPVEVFPNGVDIAVPTDEEYDRYRRVGRASIEANDGRFVFLFIGQHRWEKNVRLIIEAMKVLSDRRVDYLMLFAGSGYAEKEMHKLVANLHLNERIRFLGQISEREAIKRLYAAADLFLFPSVYDNAPLVVREAAAFGLPSVLAVNSSAAEGVVDGENGFLTENSVEGFAEKLTSILIEPETRARAGRGARATIYMSWEDVIERVLERYAEIVAEFRLSPTR
ncbi:MAG TPA: glycosyltransferase [Spirochaetia bacterium]|nr:glycosyltransferase [Spirochaetia bacterium]